MLVAITLMLAKIRSWHISKLSQLYILFIKLNPLSHSLLRMAMYFLIVCLIFGEMAYHLIIIGEISLVISFIIYSLPWVINKIVGRLTKRQDENMELEALAKKLMLELSSFPTLERKKEIFSEIYEISLRSRDVKLAKRICAVIRVFLYIYYFVIFASREIYIFISYFCRKIFKKT